MIPRGHFLRILKMARRALASFRMLSVDSRKVAACRCSKRWYGLVSRNWDRKRFYKKVVVYEHQQHDCGQGGVFGVSLDHRKLKTPLRNLFLVPSKPLAAAVAQEWEDQQEFIQPTFMHLTLLCNTAIDQPVRKTPEEQVDGILSLLDTDLLRYVCYENDELSQLQTTRWAGLLDWFNQRFHTEVTSGTGLLPEPVSHQSQEAIRDYLMAMTTWQLTGFSYSVESCKSVVLSAALTEGHLTLQQTAELALLEQHFQTTRWGRVEWAHDVDQHDMTSRLAAAKVVHSLL